MNRCNDCGEILEKVGCINCSESAFLDHNDNLNDWQKENSEIYYLPLGD